MEDGYFAGDFLFLILKCDSLRVNDEKQFEDIALRPEMSVHTNQQRQMETFNVTEERFQIWKVLLEMFIPN